MTGIVRPGEGVHAFRGLLKKAAADAATSPLARPLFRPLMFDRVAILMLHRMADAERGVEGHDPRMVRRMLADLRRRRTPLLSLREVVEALHRREPVEGMVFTIDDGYDDFDSVGARVFADYDCPVTVFVTTGFLDRKYWFWWDRIELAFQQTRRTGFDLAGLPPMPLRDQAERGQACSVITDLVKTLREAERGPLITRLLAELEVALPDTAPPQYSPLAWSSLRKHAADGLVDFGPHTVSHPHLASLSDAELAFEVEGSWSRLRAELENPLPVFCYPFGSARDVARSVETTARAAGLLAALSAIPGYVGGVDPDSSTMYRLPRFPLPLDLTDLRQVVYGVERAKSVVRRILGRQPPTAPSDLRPRAVRPAAPVADVRPIRVLYIDYSVGFGGATKSMALTLQGTTGIEPTVLTAQVPDVRELWYGEWRTLPFRRLFNYRTPWLADEWMTRHGVSRLGRRIAGKALAAIGVSVTVTNTIRIFWLCHRQRIDIVHLVNGFTPPEALLGAWLARRPAVAHMRAFLTAPARKPRMLAAAPTLVMSCSAAVRDSYLRQGHVRAPAVVMPDVVDMDLFRAADARRAEVRAQLGLRDEHLAVAIFGRVIRWKGQLTFVHAMLLAMDRDPSVVGVIVGDGSDDTERYFDEVKDLIRCSGKAGRFRLTGYIEDVEPLYAACDIVVHASIEPEPNGMVVQEAMAAGRPVIATGEGGPRELVRDGVDGRLVPPGHSGLLADAISELAANPHLCRRMGEAGRQRAALLYDIPVAASQLRVAYECLLESGRQTPVGLPPGWLRPPLEQSAAAAAD